MLLLLVAVSETVSVAVSEITMIAVTDDPEEAALVISVTVTVTVVVSPDKDSEAAVVGGHACTRLSLVSLEAMCRCDAGGKEQSEQKRQTRKKCDKPYSETHWGHGTSHFLLKGG